MVKDLDLGGDLDDDLDLEYDFNYLVLSQWGPRKNIKKTIKWFLEECHDQEVGMVLKLSVSLETIKRRVLERKIQENRVDDDEDVAIKRFKTYEQNINPVINFYKQTNLLTVVNGETSISKISDEIGGLIKAIKG